MSSLNDYKYAHYKALLLAGTTLNDLEVQFYRQFVLGGGGALVDGAANVATLRTLGTGEFQALAGNAVPAIVPSLESYPAGIGQLYNGNGTFSTGNRTTGTTLDRLVIGAALWSGPNGISIDQVDCNIVTAAAAGGVYRMGVWLVDNTANPFAVAGATQYATLLAAFGAVDTTTVGAKYITVSPVVVVPANRWFCVGGVSQVALCQPTIGLGTQTFVPSGGANAVSGIFGAASWPYVDAIAGALPATMTPGAGVLSVGHGVGFRRSA